MTRHVLILMALAIVAIAAWAYHINYNTMTMFSRVSALRGEIAKERETLQVLRVEWAYLNAPDRLAALVAQHNVHLRLVPLAPLLGSVLATTITMSAFWPLVMKVLEPLRM